MQLLHKQKATRFARVCNVFGRCSLLRLNAPFTRPSAIQCPLAAAGESPIDSSCLLVCQLRQTEGSGGGLELRGVSGGQHLRSIVEVDPGASHPPLHGQHMALGSSPLPLAAGRPTRGWKPQSEELVAAGRR